MGNIKLKSGTELPLMNLKGKDYLQVAHRLVWFREEHPDWSIECDFLNHSDQDAVAKAIVKDATGRVIASAHKEESSKDFAFGHREKAETGAIGRALALCGYGTQFEPEFDEGDRVVDSPIQPKGAVFPEQPAPGDGVQEEGVVIPYGPLAKQLVHQANPEKLKAYLKDIQDAWKAKGWTSAPKWAQPMLDEAARLGL